MAIRLLRHGSASRRARDVVHRLSEPDVELGEAACVMGGERHVDGPAYVRPLRVMVHLLCGQGDAGHEAESLAEGAEIEALADRVPIRGVRPAVERGKVLPALIAFKL